MIYATELAKQVIAEALRSANVDRRRGLRLTHGDGLFLELDEATDQDSVMFHDRKVVLIIGKDVEYELGPGLIDVLETAYGNDLVLRRKAECKPLLNLDTEHNPGQN
ncbi:MAG: hypothetical protein R6U89_08080 [Dehalococcoidia bacterium]